MYKKVGSANIVYGELPQGCKLCLRGAKAVLFVTGLCPRRCFYCPLGFDRRFRDIQFINERPIAKEDDIIEEMMMMDARGTGITGGEPLLVLERTIKYIRLIKNTFGEEHHIHMYTSETRGSVNRIIRLFEEGLDELRMHPYILGKVNFEFIEEVAKNKPERARVGIEIPALPGEESRIKKLILKLDKIGIDFINLNELEFTETNSYSLMARGYSLRSDSYTAAEGSRETALNVLKWASCKNINMTVHFCSALSKDKVQTKLRYFRRGINMVKPYEKLTDEGTILYLSVKFKTHRDAEAFIRQLKLPRSLFKVENKRVYTSIDLIDEVKKAKNIVKAEVMELSATYHRQVMGITPLL